MKLYVHSGIFHADDVFCCAFLKLYGMELETLRVPIGIKQNMMQISGKK